MTKPEPPAAALREHLEICSELHTLFLEENRVLRETGATPSEELLTRKRDYLPRLDASLDKLKRINESAAGFTREEEAIVRDGRNKLMQLLMLDRENERLLLKASMPAQIKKAFAPVIPGQVARAYSKYTERKS